MKRMILILSVALAGTLFTACSDDALSDISTTEAENMSTGSWKVSYYFDNSDGVSNELDAYELELADDGTLTITDGTNTFTGAWNIQGSDDDPNYSKELEFSIVGNSDMDKFDGKWLIAVLTDNSMELLDDTPSEELHLSRN